MSKINYKYIYDIYGIPPILFIIPSYLYIIIYISQFVKVMNKNAASYILLPAGV